MGPVKPISWDKWKVQEYTSTVPTGEAGRRFVNVSRCSVSFTVILELNSVRAVEAALPVMFSQVHRPRLPQQGSS